MAWLLFFGVWCGATALVALDVKLAVATCGIRWATLLFVPAVALRLGKDRLLRAMMWGSLLYVGGQWLFYLSGSDLGVNVEPVPGHDAVYRLGADSQQLAFEAVGLLAIASALFARKRLSGKMLGLIAALALATLMGAKSRTAALAGAAATVPLALRDALRGNRLLLLAGGGATAVCLAMLLWAVGLIEYRPEALAARVARTGNADEVTSITGRMDIWPFVWKLTLKSPLCGYGCGCASLAGYGFFDDDDPPLRHAHNEILNVVLCTGWVGAGLVLATFLQQLYLAWASPSGLPDYVALVAMIVGITEPILFTNLPTLLTILWLLALMWRQLPELPDGVPAVAATNGHPGGLLT